jgi:hypothetical protein
LRSYSLNPHKNYLTQSLLQELFLIENYQTFKYGLENTYQYLYKRLRNNNKPSSKSLRQSPDLIIYEPCDENLYYAEIKYRSKGVFNYNPMKFLNYIERFPNGYFFIATPKHFYVISFEEMRAKKEINFNDHPEYLLENSKEFNLRSLTIGHFEKFLSVFYNEDFLKLNKKIQASYRN